MPRPRNPLREHIDQILIAVASGSVPGYSLGVSDALVASKLIQHAIGELGLNKQVALRFSLSPNELFLLHRSDQDQDQDAENLEQADSEENSNPGG